MEKKAQSGVEYLIIVGFVTILVIAIFSVAVFYSNKTKDNLVLNQLENFALQLISSSENVYFSGEPSEATISLHLPKGVKNIEINTTYIVTSIQTSSGINTRMYKSHVPLSGKIDISEGIKKISLSAKEEYVDINVIS